MRLCFGTFISVLNYCRQSNILQADLIARVVKCVDPRSSYIAIDDRYKDSWDIKGDEPAISKLLHCTRNFVLSSEKAAVSKSEIADVIRNFKTNVAPFIYEDKKAMVIFALLNIIQKDKTIDSKNRKYFEKYLGENREELLQQDRFKFSDFLGRILVYTVYGNVENTVGKKYVHLITQSYINKIADFYACEYEWNQSKQTLQMTFVEIYLLLNRAIQSYQIDRFIEKIDPTAIMNDEWLEKCEDFIENVKSCILLPFARSESNMSGTTIHKVQEFIEALNEYLNYLGLNMRPIAERPSLFVPLYRDENVKWAIAFSEKVTNYRKQLILIYQDIYARMPFAENPIFAE